MNTTPTTEAKESTPTSAASSETAVRTRRVYSAQEKAEHLALFEQSGLCPADFCREMNINEGTFAGWRRQARMEAGLPEEAPHFAEVQVTTEKPAPTATSVPSTVTVHLAGGMRIEVNATTADVWQGLGVLLRTLNA